MTRRGRPPKAAGTTAENITVRVTPDELRRIDALAEEAGLRRSAYLRGCAVSPSPTTALVLPALQEVRRQIDEIVNRLDELHQAVDGVSDALRLAAEEEH